MTNAVLNRVVRRETHSPRTVAAVLVLVLVAAAATYAGAEIVLHLLGAAPLLAAPGSVLAWLGEVPDARPRSALGAAGAALGVVGAALVWLAVSPGRLSKHRLAASSHVVVVDNGVIASAVAERVRQELDLSRGGVVVGVSHRSADVTVRPEPGQEVDKSRVRSIAEAELAEYGASPGLRVRARVQRRADGGGSA
ncbi:DNA/RNA endonuclease G [Leucobacter sp. wl10]|uniref:DNA/RNA endonuclease G n=1 Tax=Leucobacter sp. wl10 TaxID=2304677 RepID=UPI000E5C0D3A|nr:DNA/RNA endonuclease G [Leucobacter sp. wl10]RGE20394.1 DNA/RNA endonuclease G [Leucobacter sp. wl10]